MSIVNIAVAIEINLAGQLALNLHYDDEGNRLASTISEEDARALSLYLSKYWKDVTAPDTGKVYRIVSFYPPLATVSEDDNKIEIVERLQAAYADDIAVVGAWVKSGAQYGMEVVLATYDEDGTELTTKSFTGLPVYPIHPLAMMAMPDDVTYDSEGLELTRAPAAMHKEVSKLGGWENRDWGTYV